MRILTAAIICAALAIPAAAQDVLPNVRGDANTNVESRPVVMVDPDGNTYVSGASGIVSNGNSTQTPLASGAEFVGEWEQNRYEHVALNVAADENGAVFIEFGILHDDADLSDGIQDGEVTVTFSDTEPVYADTPYFRALVKGPERVFRIRYLNNGTPQSDFRLWVAYGSSLFPPSATRDNELLVTTTPQERNTFVGIAGENVSATGYAILIDLDDTTNFLHDRTGRVDLSAMYIFVDKDNSTTGAVSVGVITAIDGTSATIEFVQSARFSNASDREIVRDRNFAPSQLQLGVSDGNLTRAIGVVDAGITAVNTGITLTTAAGTTVTPAVGDVVIRYLWTGGGTYDWTVSTFYHGERTP